MEEQPLPERAACPNCGGKPEHNPKHTLRALGYPHDDIQATCSDCGKVWTMGRPIGDVPERYERDMRCDACYENDGSHVYGRVNWIRWQADRERFAIALKCPACNYVWSVMRDATNGATMMGDPVVAGDLDAAESPFKD